MSNIHSYPEPPPTPDDFSPPLQREITTNAVSPELPSKLWPWLIAAVALVALSVQTWSLVGLLRAGRDDAEFRARVTAWETANKNRQQAVDTWDSIQSELNANVDQLREQASLLRGSIDSLQKQRDQLAETTTSQSKTLETLNESEVGLQKQLADLREQLASIEKEQQQVKLESETAKSATATIAAENEKLKTQGRKIQEALATIEEKERGAEEQVAVQQRLVASNEQKLKDMETRISQLDAFLQSRLTDAAKLKLQQEKAKQVVDEIKQAETKLAENQTEILKATGKLTALKEQIGVTTAENERTTTEQTTLEQQVAAAQKRLADLRKGEQELNDRLAAMMKTINSTTAEATESLTKMTATAAKTIQEIAEKAADVRAAVKELQVAPAIPDGPLEKPESASAENESTASTGSDSE